MATCAATSRGAQTINSFSKPMLRKAYHQKSSPLEEVKTKSMANNNNNNRDGNFYVRDERTGIFYPKGQEKVIQDIPVGAGKELERINWFATHESSH
ncbi:hypothetical protein Leryth_005758 [Lithospermum erythrorhizon]|uniref:Uncharacterized protein n=1 Tax=Lithospermum erythrorhizon TaxID=34254 RepID=A0AAV3QKE9_LITER|nr:hypothetical protein Leryth_005758 [Lithospermum erythrorhizon]